MNRINVMFDITQDVEVEAHVDSILQIVELTMNTRLAHIKEGKGSLHPVDWSNLLLEDVLTILKTINTVGATVKEGEEVPDEHINNIINSLININATSIGALQNLTYKDIEYEKDNTSTD